MKQKTEQAWLISLALPAGAKEDYALYLPGKEGYQAGHDSCHSCSVPGGSLIEG